MKAMPTLGRLSFKGAPRALFVLMTLLLFPCVLDASDHADPIDPFNRIPLEGGITDLFVFPVDANGALAEPFQRPQGPERKKRPELTREQQGKLKDLVVILCVRRALSETGSLMLEPYTYSVHMDLHRAVSFDNDEQRVRYGGTVDEPTKIEPDVTFSFRLNNDATLKEFTATGNADLKQITTWTGVRDDPFIFPAFFGTNVVAMVMKIPFTWFSETQKEWIVWATSRRGSRQIDHVGRSLRTQNPRFEILNTLPPKDHVAAIKHAAQNPTLIQDLALQFNLKQIFEYRAWDYAPDVMIYSRRYPIGYPNGRWLEDDVAELLAQNGDTLLKELSYVPGAMWPRATRNDKDFLKDFPYLAAPWPDKPPAKPRTLTMASWVKIWSILGAIILVLVVENVLVIRLYSRFKRREPKL